MPIEIKELHIKIHVGEDGSETKNAQTGPAEKDTVSSETIEEVMEILRLQKER